MQIKNPPNQILALKILQQKKLKLLFCIIALFLYSIGIFLIGGVAYKDGFFGKVIKPVILENINIPINYIKSFRASPEQIVLDIKHKDFQKLAYKRELALAEGVLHSSAKDYVPAKIRWRGKTVKVKTRLKGDLADHWSDKTKWSFRIKTRKNETVLGMKKFSLQHPFTRGFLNDWYLHQLLKHIKGFNILRYEFVNLTVNGKNLGIYLLEEHFGEMLLKNNKYINAPIIRIYDHLLWYNVDPIIGFTRPHINEHYTISPIDAFKTNTVNSSKTLLMNFNQAKNLLESFRQGRLLTHQVFEIKKLAKLFAVIDLFGYHHSTAYSNIRFYYNPVTSLLEPIGYDNTFIKKAQSIQGQACKLKILSSDRPQYIDPDVYQKWYKTFLAIKYFLKNI